MHSPWQYYFSSSQARPTAFDRLVSSGDGDDDDSGATLLDLLRAAEEIKYVRDIHRVYSDKMF